MSGGDLHFGQVVLQRSRSLRNYRIIVEIERLSLPGEVVEDSFVLCLLDSVFHKSVQIFHRIIVSFAAEYWG